VPLGVRSAFLHEDLARTRDGLEGGGIELEPVLTPFPLDPCGEIFADGNGDALGIPALALGIARGGEFASGIGCRRRVSRPRSTASRILASIALMSSPDQKLTSPSSCARMWLRKVIGALSSPF